MDRLLTTPQQERLRRLVRRSPAFIGMSFEVYDDRVEINDPEPLTLGFTALSALVAEAPPDDWPEVVDQYLKRILELGSGPPAELDGPTEDILGRIYPRLLQYPESRAEVPAYAEEMIPGLLLLFAFDLPDAMAYLIDEHVHRHGFDRLYDAGLHNLYGELPERFVESDGLYLVQGSDYVSSLVLLMPWVIEAVTGLTETPHGALVAMPGRDQLLFHVIQDRAGVLRAMEQLGELAGEWYAEHPFALSPRLYWWRPLPVGGAESVAHHDGTRLVTYYSDAFADMLHDVDREREWH